MTRPSLRSTRSRLAALAVALVAALVAAPLAGCGADDDAPAPASQALPPDPCPDLREIAPNTFALLDEGALPGMRRLFAERITDTQLAAVLDLLLTVLDTLTPEQLEGLLALTENPAIAELFPLVETLLRWIVGDPTDPASYQSALVSELRRLVAVCDTQSVLGVVEAAVASEELPRLLGGLGEVLALDLVQQVLDAGEALDRDGFTVLVCNMLSSLVRPGFSVQDDVIEPLSGIDLLPLGEPPIGPFLADLDAALDPEGPLLPVLSDLVCCDVYGVPRCAALTGDAAPLSRDPVFTWALHALFTGGVVDIEAALSAASKVVADPQIAAALEPLVAVTNTLAADPDVLAAWDSLLVTVLEPQTARALLGELVLLLDAGALDELLALLRALTGSCTADELAGRVDAETAALMSVPR